MKAKLLSADYKVELMQIGSRMTESGLPNSFIAAAIETGFEFEGVYNLIKMWDEEEDSQERDEIIADIQDLIDDCNQLGKVEGTYVRFDDLAEIAKDIRSFKDSLRMVVEEHGGLSHLSQLTGIPQPSLSRFFNSASMPRRTTLIKIAKALDLSQVQISTKWSR